MASAQHTTNERRVVDRDGVTRVEQPRTGSGVWIVGLAVAFLVACLALSAWLTSAPADVPPAPPVRVAGGPAPGAVVERLPAPPPRPVVRPSPVKGPPPAAPPQAPPPEEAPPMPTHTPPGGESGLSLFHPGIKPIKTGIIVPEGFQLPPGYVRHYQTTDDGKQMPAILMFHPDYKPLDANGQPVPLPADRIVPPELAPAGLPIQMLEVPKGGGASGQGQ